MDSLRSHKHIKTLTLLTGLLLSSSFAHAQNYETSKAQRDQELSVFYRTNPELLPIGIDLGIYTLFPSLTTQITHTDNTFSRETNRDDDIIYSIQPNLRLRSNLDQHRLDFFINANQRYYNKATTENRLEYNFGTNARYDLTGNIFIPVNISYEQIQSGRGDPDDTNIIEPTESNVLNTNTGVSYRGYLAEADILIGRRDYSFDDALRTTGIQNNQDRNRTETTGRLRLGVARNDLFAPYVYSNYRDIDYDQQIDDNGFNRSAEEIEAGIGTYFRLNALTTSRIEIGHTSFNPEDTRFETVRDLTYLANITWEPTSLLALTLSGERNVSTTTLNNLTASIDSSVNVGLLYELDHNIFISPGYSYELREYEGNTTAELEQQSVGFRADYRMNNNLWWSGEYRYIKQSSPDNSPQIGEYDRNDFLISLRVQF